MRAFDKSTGVYRITCKPTGKIYIGSTSVGFVKRWNHHKHQLRRNTHDSKYLQNSWNKYGPEAFDFEILVVCAKENVLLYEQIFLDALKPHFNTCKIAGSNQGVRHSDEIKQRMSAAQRAVRPKYEFDGEFLCLSDIAERTEASYETLVSRVLGQDMSVTEALEKPKRVVKYVLTHGGVTKDINEWAKEFGCHAKRIQSRLVKGWSFEECVHYFNRVEKRLSFSEFCRLANVNLQTAKSRLQKGCGVMDAITQPVRSKEIS
jgi:group I intron endonuclease